MLYTKELVAPRPKARQGLLRFESHRMRKKYDEMTRTLFAHSTIHGLQNVFIGDHRWVRCFWLIIVLLAIGGFLVGCSILENRHKEHVLISVTATTQLPVYNIEFPAVAICPWNHVNWLRAATAADRFLPHDADRSMRETFRQMLVGMEQTTFGNFEPLGALSNRNLSSFSYLSLKKLAGYLAYRCDELFVPGSCQFDETPYDCCELFVPEHMEKGQCLVFNSLISDESRKKKLVNEFYPFKVSKAGEGSGLKFLLRLNDSFLREGTEVPFSMNLMIKQPHQWSQPMLYHLYANTENFVSVDPLVIETSRNTYAIHPSKRGCYFDDERNPYYRYAEDSLIYSRDNCIAVCLQMSVLDHCKCTMPLYLPPISGTRECNILDTQCVYRHRDVFGYIKMSGQEKYINDQRRGQICRCPDSCYKQQYNMLLNVEVFYGQRMITKIETKLRYTFIDGVAGFGGILGLYIGASSLSFIDLVYVLAQLLWSLLKDAYAKVTRNSVQQIGTIS